MLPLATTGCVVAADLGPPGYYGGYGYGYNYGYYRPAPRYYAPPPRYYYPRGHQGYRHYRW
jgi:hypothetical protein